MFLIQRIFTNSANISCFYFVLYIQLLFILRNVKKKLKLTKNVFFTQMAKKRHLVAVSGTPNNVTNFSDRLLLAYIFKWYGEQVKYGAGLICNIEGYTNTQPSIEGRPWTLPFIRGTKEMLSFVSYHNQQSLKFRKVLLDR